MGKYTLPEMPYAYDALEPHIDARTMEIHHTKHHQKYTDGMNGALEKKYTNEDYPTYTSKYRAIIAATTFFPTLKYWENAAVGCLTFMEITKKNNGYFLGYKDNETAIFINEKNYKEKFQQYMSDLNNPKWEEIANAGREYTMNNLTNDQAVSSLVELMKEVT